MNPWHNPLHRAKLLETVRSPERKAAVRAGIAKQDRAELARKIKEGCNRPEIKAAQSERSKRLWNTAAYRLKMAAALAGKGNPEHSAAVCRAIHSNPEATARRLAALRAAAAAKTEQQDRIMAEVAAELGISHDCNDVALLRRAFDERGLYATTIARWIGRTPRVVAGWMRR
jgi:hypothetical protein